jgi:hypothetical protein
VTVAAPEGVEVTPAQTSSGPSTNVVLRFAIRVQPMALFLLPHCPEGHASSPHARQCDSCGSLELTAVPASRDATVVSWAVIPQRPAEAGSDEPVVLCIAQLAEGPWWWSRITDADPDRITVGTPLRIAFQRRSKDHEAVPVFAVVDSSP